ncbi:unnamed protein product [Fraxinus pennsylvanica]|uniref:poly(A)-specific ribonuclease n=1 Tax=Fraxinus pennsylvanica TaxID=56036 RepID=A0AAD2AEK9_9LAMI|nr:unnamed protein product [Fraxinus pennsylvanica]
MFSVLCLFPELGRYFLQPIELKERASVRVYGGTLRTVYQRACLRADDFPYIAIDTEFSGIALRPLGNFKSSSEYHFHTLKVNVDLLKVIQLGLTFFDEKENLPTCGIGKYYIWQFNFREFDRDEDVYAHDSIELLTHSGIDFEKNIEQGIDAYRFSDLMMSSGIVLNDNVHWVTFHSAYDFGYLLKLLTC